MASDWRSKQPSGQLVWPGVQDFMQLPFKQNFPVGQTVPQYPQFPLSVSRSAQVSLHGTLSDGQKSAFVTGTVVGTVAMMVVGIRVVAGMSGTVVGGSVGTSVPTIAYDPPTALPGPAVTSGVGAGVTGFPAEERIEEPVSRGYPTKRTTSMRMTSTAATARILVDFIPGSLAGERAWPGGDHGEDAEASGPGRSGLRVAPQWVQNFLSGSTALPHWGQNFRKITNQIS